MTDFLKKYYIILLYNILIVNVILCWRGSDNIIEWLHYRQLMNNALISCMGKKFFSP